VPLCSSEVFFVTGIIRDVITLPFMAIFAVPIGIGIATGAALGVAFDNMAVGIGIGMAFGASIGALRAQRDKQK
jgi:hypothetical protein